jgi:hypothetical protein
MTECKDQRWLFQDLGNRKVEVDFGGGYLSSDGGGLILRELERHNGLYLRGSKITDRLPGLEGFSAGEAVI